MILSVARARHYLKTRDFERLFTEELGWDRHDGTLTVAIADQPYTLRALAQKRGVQIFECAPGADGRIPDRAIRLKIERQVAKSAFEHLLIFVDEHEGKQIWQWVLREPGRPAVPREEPYDAKRQSGDLLIQKFERISFALSDEESLSLTGVVHRLRDAFDRDRLTKRFYDQFKLEHAAFLRLIKGIKDQADREWYASLMLNRLMFIWFIQQKCFLASDARYLQNRLQLVQSSRGKGKFLSFYRQFLRRLFHEGLGQQKPQRSPDLETLLGDIPYLNGGLFEVHELEENNPDLDIPDEAFETLFAFFDQWDWHLDERPLASGREINPDVLGYIFEKYINQKQMGAYYTKEDITEYIGKSTIVPYLFDAARKKCAVAFEPGSAVWNLLREDPDRYIHEPVRRGVIGPGGVIIPESALPEFVQKGMHDPKKRMFDRRYNLADADLQDDGGRKLTLPTETWREYVNRRTRCLEVREQLASGEVHEINDLVTLNLDIRQFAEDVIAFCEGPELLRAFYQVIRSVSVLDPTCGSGAFLFAGLNILESLYEACLDRMQVFLEDLERSGERHRPEKFSDFKRTLAEVEKHPNRRYFILKSIMVNNLYGVDIMEEAVEICKLRLFLKLVAQVDRQDKLEPLPDIDFNIQAGNTLVGFASREDVRRTTERKSTGQVGLPFAETGQALRRIEEEAELVDRAFHVFNEMQTKEGMDAAAFATAKQDLRTRLSRLSDELDSYLAREYGVDTSKSRIFEAWKRSHQPFHWFAVFYGRMASGGFDVIIGNPPYIEYNQVRGQYQLQEEYSPYLTNLYAACCYRTQTLKSARGYSSFIVPVSLPSTDRMQALRNCLLSGHAIHIVSFSTRPSKLFSGAEQRLSIYIQSPAVLSSLYAGGYLKWSAQERAALFQSLTYSRTAPIRRRSDLWPKVGDETASRILEKLSGFNPLALSGMLGSGASLYYKNTGLRYFNTVTLRPPRCWINGKETSSSRETVLDVVPQFRHPIHAILLSTTYFLYYQTTSNCRDLNPADIASFPAPAIARHVDKLNELSRSAEEDYVSKGRIITMNNRLTGRVEIESVTPSRSKGIIDKIDVCLSKDYHFTDEELDFIVNYDIKYRIGQSNDDEE